MTDMREPLFENEPYGKAALAELLQPADPNFRFYCAAHVGKRGVMRLDGAIFREAKSGKNKGKLCIKVEDTEQTVYVTREEIDKFREEGEDL